MFGLGSFLVEGRAAARAPVIVRVERHTLSRPMAKWLCAGREVPRRAGSPGGCHATLDASLVSIELSKAVA